MKKFTLIAASFLMTYMAQAQTETAKPVGSTPVVTPAIAQVEPKDIAKTLEFKNADYDFGKIPHGKQAEYELTIKNISRDSVTLDRVQVGCGCTTPKYEANKKFGPGESIKVTLGFNGSSEGAFTKFATIFFSDGMSKQVTFKGETYKTPDTSAPANAPLQKMKSGTN